MDVVYIVGTGSRWQNNELRFSLRSVDRFLKNYDRVFIVGHKPEFVTNVEWIPCKDISEYAGVNIMYKLKLACKVRDISDSFVFFNDDYYLLKDRDTDDIGMGYSGTLQERLARINAETSYKPVLQNTIKILISEHRATRNFDIHTPNIYHKGSLLYTMGKYDWSIPYGYTLKSLYGNNFNNGYEESEYNLKKNTSKEQFFEQLKDKPLFSSGSRVGSPETLTFFEELYPDKSRFEL